MNLYDIVKPIIDYIATLCFASHAINDIKADEVKKQIDVLFDNIYSEVQKGSLQTELVSKIMLPLIFYIDYMIMESEYQLKNDWVLMGAEIGELTGDSKFFSIFDTYLKDNSRESIECLKIMTACINTGFMGCYKSRPYEIKRRLLASEEKIKTLNIPLFTSKTTTIKSNKNNKKLLFSPKLVFFISLCIFIVTFLCSIMYFYFTTSNLQNTLNEITTYQSE